jgi:hypothetical protein
MKKLLTTILLVNSILISCGPSAEQIAAEEKRKLDSVAATAQQQILDQQAVERAAAEEAANQEMLKQQLIEFKAQLAGAEAKLQNINQFQFGRTSDEKVSQITDQTRVVEEIKAQITDVEKQIK